MAKVMLKVAELATGHIWIEVANVAKVEEIRQSLVEEATEIQLMTSRCKQKMNLQRAASRVWCVRLPAIKY